MEREQEKTKEQGQEINAKFRGKKEPNSREELKEDLADPKDYQKENVKANELESPEWPSREYTNRDKPSRH